MAAGARMGRILTSWSSVHLRAAAVTRFAQGCSAPAGPRIKAGFAGGGYELPPARPAEMQTRAVSAGADPGRWPVRRSPPADQKLGAG
jgi:hypothetical protein